MKRQLCVGGLWLCSLLGLPVATAANWSLTDQVLPTRSAPADRYSSGTFIAPERIRLLGTYADRARAVDVSPTGTMQLTLMQDDVLFQHNALGASFSTAGFSMWSGRDSITGECLVDRVDAQGTRQFRLRFEQGCVTLQPIEHGGLVLLDAPARVVQISGAAGVQTTAALAIPNGVTPLLIDARTWQGGVLVPGVLQEGDQQRWWVGLYNLDGSLRHSQVASTTVPAILGYAGVYLGVDATTVWVAPYRSHLERLSTLDATLQPTATDIVVAPLQVRDRNLRFHLLGSNVVFSTPAGLIGLDAQRSVQQIAGGFGPVGVDTLGRLWTTISNCNGQTCETWLERRNADLQLLDQQARPELNDAGTWVALADGAMIAAAGSDVLRLDAAGAVQWRVTPEYALPTWLADRQFVADGAYLAVEDGFERRLVRVNHRGKVRWSVPVERAELVTANAQGIWLFRNVPDTGYELRFVSAQGTVGPVYLSSRSLGQPFLRMAADGSAWWFQKNPGSGRVTRIGTDSSVLYQRVLEPFSTVGVFLPSGNEGDYLIGEASGLRRYGATGILHWHLPQVANWVPLVDGNTLLYTTPTQKLSADGRVLWSLQDAGGPAHLSTYLAAYRDVEVDFHLTTEGAGTDAAGVLQRVDLATGLMQRTAFALPAQPRAASELLNRGPLQQPLLGVRLQATETSPTCSALVLFPTDSDAQVHCLPQAFDPRYTPDAWTDADGQIWAVVMPDRPLQASRVGIARFGGLLSDGME